MPSIALTLLGVSVGLAGPNSYGASVSSTARIGLSGCASAPSECSWLSFQDAAVVSPWAIAKPNAAVAAKGALDLRIHSPSQEAPNARGRTVEASARFTDAWVSIRSRLTDLTVGVQRIPWGVGQGYSLVDTINPLNLEDPTRFDRRLSVMAAHGSIFTDQLDASVVVIPFFVPAALPASGIGFLPSGSGFFDDQFTGSTGLTLGSITTRTSMPKNTLGETSVGARIRYTPRAGDFALSWHRGRDSIPQANGDLVLVGFQTVEGRVDVGVPIEFPQQDILGFSLRTTLPGDTTTWFEATRTVSTKMAVAPSLAQMEGLVSVGAIDTVPDPIQRTVTQDGTPVLRWLVGVERPIGPLRVSGQWLHGFFTERTVEAVSDYALLTASWSATRTIRLEASGATDLNGHLVSLGFTTLHGDAAEVEVGGTVIEGRGGSPFAALESASHLHTTVRMRF